MPYPKDEKQLKTWEDHLSFSIAKDPKPWNTYDDQIQAAVVVFNAYLAGKALYNPLDWQKIKAMAWVETGPFAQNDAWNSRPMQIGNRGDAGLHDLLTSVQGKLIMPPQFLVGINEGNAGSVGRLNIIVGIGYLLRRLGKFGIVFDPVPATDPRNAVPIKGQNGIIGTIDPDRSSEVKDKLTGDGIPANRTIHTIGPHHKVGHHHDHHRAARGNPHMSVIGWKVLTPEFASKYYNGGGDGNYAAKLEFAYKTITGTPWIG